MTNSQKYHDAVLDTLKEADPKVGMPLRHIVRHVYNMTCCDMFNESSLEEVKRSVSRIVHKELKSGRGLIEKSNKRGYYKINVKRLELLETTLLLDFD